MKLSKLYSNKPNLFQPINLRQDLNVILAEIRLPENRNKDTHNLGKSTLGRLLDFSFLARRDKNFFLFKYPQLFKKFIFFLEIQLPDSSFVTVRRSVETHSKISFKKHEFGYQNFIDLRNSEWDHFEVPFDRAKTLLDSLLDWEALKPWDYRKGLGYQLRSQDDFRNVFQLQKFAGHHSDWKPFLAHILGFDASLINDHYDKESELKQHEHTEELIKSELGGDAHDFSKVEGLLLLKQKELDKKQLLLDAFDFRSPDAERTEQLVYEIDEKISSLNSERYSLSHNKKKILAALQENQVLFKPYEAQRLFEEAGILFQGQIVRDFEQLIAFNKAITDERRTYLKEEYDEIEVRLSQVVTELDALGKQRSDMLSFLSDTNIFEKYRKFSGEIVILRADISALNQQKIYLHRLQEARASIRNLQEERAHLQTQIEADVERQNSDKESVFSSIRVFFSDIVDEVIDRKALLSVSTNQAGHLEFKAEILDESGNSTSADLGHTYRKLLCIAFDLAVLRAHLDKKFPRFVYHDGVFESLDDRKKENLLAVINRYTELGIQSIITSIDSDLPMRNRENFDRVFAQEQIVLTLHDENETGRLFKIVSW